MILELENKFAVIDLRTPKNVLDFIKMYDVDIPSHDRIIISVEVYMISKKKVECQMMRL